MIHSFEDMIAYISECETLHVGEFFGSGTMAGCCSLECDRWMKDGDVIEVEFERIGVLRNPVANGEFMDYFKADFHPWMHDNSKFLTEIDNFVAGVEGAGRKPNTEITNAIRARLNSQLKASAA